MKRVMLFMALAAIFSTSCQRGLVSADIERSGPYSVGHEMIELGEQMDDPYSLTNMTKALRSLYPTKAGTLSATDMYVRFLPKDEEQYDLLGDMGVSLVDHPLDYRIVKDGDYYHDPEIDEGKITWQYAVVKPDFPFPEKIRYEILDDCYIPDTSPVARVSEDGIDWAAVEAEAYRITGNEEMLSPQTKGGSGGPRGKIQIVDDKYNGGKPCGVKGVQVSVNTFVKFATAYTDEDGNYQIDKTYSSDIHYRLVFKNVKGFGIGFNLLLVPASISTLGKNSPDGIDVLIDKNSERKQFARSVVNNAVYDYFTMTESTDQSVRTPPSNLRMWLFQNIDMSCSPMFQQGAIIDSDVVSGILGIYREILKIFMPDVLLGLKGCDDYASIYAAALHQLAHTSHYMKTGNSFWDKLIIYNIKAYLKSGFIAYGTGTESDAGCCEVCEMWAYFMQNSLYRDRYGKDCPAMGATYWFHPQIFLYLEDRGINRGKIFKALEGDVTDRDALEKRLLRFYPENKSIIEQAFEKYSY